MRYRKKPVIIEAVQNIPNELTPSWLHHTTQLGATIKIQTLEGTMTADIGDYIIRGIKGELYPWYPCKPDIFEATYEKVGAND